MSTITIKIGIFLTIYDSNDKYVESHNLGFDFIEFPPHPNLENNYNQCSDNYYYSDELIRTLKQLYTDITIYEDYEWCNNSHWKKFAFNIFEHVKKDDDYDGKYVLSYEIWRFSGE